MKANQLGDDLRSVHYQQRPGRVYMILCLITVCYFGKYYCTSDMYVVQKHWIKENNLTEMQLSCLFALGFVLSMVGKPTAGILSDMYGGKPVCMTCAFGYITSTLLFTLVPQGWYPAYLFFWAMTGFFALGIAWVSVVAVCLNWVPDSHVGRLMSVVNMAPQLGDALARASLAPVVLATHSAWRTVFRVAAGAAVCVTLPALLLVPNAPRPEDVGLEPEARVAKEKRAADGGDSFFAKLKPLLSQPLLYVVGALSGTLYAIRACFLLYAVAYLGQTYCQTNYSKVTTDCVEDPQTEAATAVASTAYTMMGCVSVLIVGQLKDRLPQKHRAGILVCFLCILVVVLSVMFTFSTSLNYDVSACCIALVGFTLFGPYKILGTAFAVDIGGKKFKATACSVMGMCDNLMAVVVLLIKGQCGDNWQMMLGVLLFFGCVCLCCALTCWKMDLNRAKLVSAREHFDALSDGLL